MRYLFIIFFLFLSCASDLDFEQTDDIIWKPSIDLSVLKSEFKLSDYPDPTLLNSLPILSESIIINLFDDSFDVNYLKIAEFEFELVNTFDRAISLKFIFLDNLGNESFSILLDDIPAGTIANPSVIVRTITLSQTEIEQLILSYQLYYEIDLNTDTSPFSVSSKGYTQILSKLKLAFEIKN